MSEIKTVGVLGAGQMGRGIAQVAAQAGLNVLVLDRDQPTADAGVARIRADLDKMVEKGKATAADRDALLARMRASGSIAILKEADFVIEAATENFELKQKLFAEVDAVLPKDKIIASNTSSISLTKIAGSTKRPEQVVGMHFFNPVPVMKLVEIIKALQTSDATYQATKELGLRFGKTVVTSKDMPGFMVNRILIPFLNEACFTLQEGVGTVEDIDTSAKLGLNHPMGPFELADLIGLDTCLFVSEVLQRELGDDKYRPAAILRNYVAAGWLGRKTGRGFYNYAK